MSAEEMGIAMGWRVLKIAVSVISRGRKVGWTETSISPAGTKESSTDISSLSLDRTEVPSD